MIGSKTVTASDRGRQQRLIYIYMLLFSVVIGILSGAGAIFFRALIEIFQELFWSSGDTFTDRVSASFLWLRILVPSSLGLLTGLLMYYLIPEARGPGVSEVILAVTNKESTIRHRVTFLKALITGMLIGGGASVGREGPIVQIGASIGSSTAQIFKLSPELRRACLAAGVAAGISATFNAPISGTLFAIEIILLDIDLSYISHIVVASVIGSVISRIFLGNFPAFHAPLFEVSFYWELGIYLLLGLLGGIIAICFGNLIGFTENLFIWLRIPEWLKPGIGGLFLGIIALKLPQVLGVGYETVNAALSGSLLLKAALIMLLAKMTATAFCVGSGMSGGIFAPSLVLGASLGTSLCFCINLFLPDSGLNPLHYALVGMGAVVSGTTLAPITAVITIFELTYNEQIILPLMITCISSAVLVRLASGYSVYEMKLLRRGINIVRGHDVGILRSLHAGDFITHEFETLQENTPLPVILEMIMESSYPHFIVMNQNNELAGFLSLRDVRSVINETEFIKDLVIAADMMKTEVIKLSAGDNLETALHVFETRQISCVPVTDIKGRILGILKKDDLLRAYKEHVLKNRLLSAASHS